MPPAAPRARRRALFSRATSIRLALAAALACVAPAQAQTGPASATTLKEVTVTGEAAGASYTAPTSTATRLNLPLHETPQSITVITRDKLDDQGVSTLDQALERTPGVTVQTSGNVTTYYYSRGFEMAVQVDGMNSGYTTSERGLVNLGMYDRVEVLRGAAGLMSGAGQPGGVVNLIRKRPTAQRQLIVTGQYGSWADRRGEFDIAGPLNASGSLRGRAVLNYDEKNYFYDTAHNRNVGGYVTLEQDLGPATVLSAGYSRFERDVVPEITGVPRRADGSDSGLSPRRYLGAAWNRWSVDSTMAFAGLEHRFDNGWKFKAQAKREHRLLNYKRAFYRAASVDLATLTATEMDGYYSGDMTVEDRGVEASLNGAFGAFGRRHEALVGFNRQELREPRPWQSMRFAIPATPLARFDPRAIPEPQTPAVPATSEGQTDQSSVYGMLRLQPADRLHVILGGRLGNWRSQSLNYRTGAVTNRYQERSVFTPYAGLVYELDSTWSAYASYSDVFRVQSNYYTAGGQALDPAVGANYEGGLKGQWLDGRLNASFALFQIVEDNRALLDPDHPQPCAGSPSAGACYINAGKVRSRGFETEVAGQLRPGWQVAAGYTFNNTKYLKDIAATGGPSANEGRSYSPYTPRHILRLWSSVRVPGAPQWTIGGGGSVQSETWNQSGTVRITQPGMALVDAFVSWQIDPHWKLSLNVDNLLDKGYYRKLGTVTGGNYYGTPRSALLTLRGYF